MFKLINKIQSKIFDKRLKQLITDIKVNDNDVSNIENKPILDCIFSENQDKLDLISKDKDKFNKEINTSAERKNDFKELELFYKSIGEMYEA